MAFKLILIVPGLAVGLLVAMGEAAALGLQSFDQGAHETGGAQITARREVVLRRRFSGPSRGGIVFSLPKEGPPHAKQMLVRQRVEQHEEIRLRHWMRSDHLVHLL